MTSDWLPRFPDLAGKAVVAAGESGALLDVIGMLARNRAQVAVVAGARGVVDAATAAAERLGSPVVGFTVDPGEPATWTRIAPHVEQRLGPIDVVIVAGGEPTRGVVIAALLPDMAARHRGVVVAIGDEVPPLQPPPGVRFRRIHADPQVRVEDIAVAALACASDVFAVPSLLVSLGAPPGEGMR